MYILVVFLLGIIISWGYLFLGLYPKYSSMSWYFPSLVFPIVLLLSFLLLFFLFKYYYKFTNVKLVYVLLIFSVSFLSNSFYFENKYENIISDYYNKTDFKTLINLNSYLKEDGNLLVAYLLLKEEGLSVNNLNSGNELGELKIIYEYSKYYSLIDYSNKKVLDILFVDKIMELLNVEVGFDLENNKDFEVSFYSNYVYVYDKKTKDNIVAYEIYTKNNKVDLVPYKGD